MIKSFVVFLTASVGIFIIDQNLKSLFLNGFRWSGEYISLVLVFNKGVAFSMFSFLKEYLKYIQLGIFALITLYLFLNREIFCRYSLPLGILYGAGLSNIYDRFVYGGVVDYIYWHKWFDFAVFNFADMMIDLSVVLILFISYKKRGEEA